MKKAISIFVLCLIMLASVFAVEKFCEDSEDSADIWTPGGVNPNKFTVS